MKTLAFFFAMMVTGLFGEVEPVKLASLVVNGREYKQASITKFNVSLCRVVHSTGAARIPMKLLSKELQDKLGYSAEEERLEAEIAKKVEMERAEKAYYDALPFERFWVSENTKEGLIVGNFVSYTIGGGSVATSMGRVGGGGGSYISKGKEVWERDYKYSFIPHTEKTKGFACEHEFQAKIRKDGTLRLDEQTVVEKLQIIQIKD
jgi:hypothetical protein